MLRPERVEGRSKHKPSSFSAGFLTCSIKGNQQHPVSGSLAPGETKRFPGPAGTIWSNSDRDDGALYNAQGQLISYWRD